MLIAGIYRSVVQWTQCQTFFGGKKLSKYIFHVSHHGGTMVDGSISPKIFFVLQFTSLNNVLKLDFIFFYFSIKHFVLWGCFFVFCYYFFLPHKISLTLLHPQMLMVCFFQKKRKCVSSVVVICKFNRSLSISFQISIKWVYFGTFWEILIIFFVILYSKRM